MTPTRRLGGFVNRRVLIVAALVLIGIAAGGIATVAQDTLYQAEASIVPSAATGLLDPAVGGDDIQTSARTVAELATSDAVLAAMLEAVPGAAKDVDELAGRVSARVPQDTALIEMTAQAPTAEDAQSLAQGGAEALVAAVGGLRGDAPAAGDLRLAVLPPSGEAHQVSPTPVLNLAVGAAAGLLAGLFITLLLPAARRQSASDGLQAGNGVPIDDPRERRYPVGSR